MLGILGVDARLDRVAAQQHVALLELERPAGGDLELPAHEVDARDQLRDRVLDLDARVHLEEVPAAVGREQELGGAGADVADRVGEAQRRDAELAAELAADAGRGRLLDHLLVAALHRAVALAQMEAGAVRIAQDLHLDVARALDVALVDEPAVAEGGLGLARRGLDRRDELAGIAHHAHAAAAAAGARLDEQRVADLVRVGAARHDGHARALRQLARGVLAPERRERAGRRAHEHEPRRAAGLGQLGRLREEAVAGVERLRARRRGGHGERGGVQVARHLDRGVGLALGDGAALVGRHEREAAHAELAARADDAHGDLAAAGHGHALERRAHQRGSRRSRNAAMPSRPSARRAALGDRVRRARRLRRRIAVAQAGDQRLGRAHRLRPGAQHGGEDARDGLVERRVVGVHLVREADPRARARC